MGEPLTLGPKERRLLSILMERPGRVFSRAQLLDMVWGHGVYVERGAHGRCPYEPPAQGDQQTVSATVERVPNSDPHGTGDWLCAPRAGRRSSSLPRDIGRFTTSWDDPHHVIEDGIALRCVR